MKLKTRDIVYIGFIAALCAVATTIRIESTRWGHGSLRICCIIYIIHSFWRFIWWF